MSDQTKHLPDCQLGDNWKECPACLELQHVQSNLKEIERNGYLAEAQAEFWREFDRVQKNKKFLDRFKP